jgi:serine protease Do
MSLRRFASSLAAAFVCIAPCTFAEEAKSESLSDAIAREVRGVFNQSRGAVCRIEADDEHGRLSGTGFLVDSDGTLFTSYTIGGTTEDIVVSIGDEKFSANRLVADERCGLAVLKIEADKPLPFLKSGSSAALALAAPVVVLGYPLDLPLSPSFGIVAGFDIGFQGRYFATRHIRASAPAQKGQGGSPIVNFKGETVGVLISTLEGGSGLFALPIEAADKILHDFRNHGHIRRGWLGAGVRITDAPEHDSTARIRNLITDGPGHKGGLRVGDVLLQMGAWKITNPEDVLNAAFYLTASDPVKVRISRAGHIHDLNITPIDPPNDEAPTIERLTQPFLGSNGVLELGP